MRVVHTALMSVFSSPAPTANEESGGLQEDLPLNKHGVFASSSLNPKPAQMGPTSSGLVTGSPEFTANIYTTLCNFSTFIDNSLFHSHLRGLSKMVPPYMHATHMPWP